MESPKSCDDPPEPSDSPGAPPKKRSAAWLNITRPTKRPDLDNYMKLALDACTGVVYGDDSQIVKLSGSKWYGEPGLEVHVYRGGETPRGWAAGVNPLAGLL